MGKEELKADNLNATSVINDIKKIHKSKEDCEFLIKMMLDSILVFDSNKGVKSELKKLMKDLSEYLYEKIRETYMYINLLQVKVRLGENISDYFEELKKIKEEEKENSQILTACYILLGNYKEAKKIIKRMNKEDALKFKQFPIYNLIKLK